MSASPDWTARQLKAGKCAECTAPGVARLKAGGMKITDAVPELRSAIRYCSRTA
jgi:hypothetical protein